MHKRKLKFAIVGLGHIAQAAVLPAFQQKNLSAEISAFVSGDSKKLKKLGRKYKVKSLYDYAGYEELLETEDIDAVYICTPNTEHYTFALAALNKGIHVLCEKPLCPTPDECEHLIKVAKKNRAKLMTAYRLHFDPTNLKAVELIKKNKIGKPVIFNSLFSYQIKKKNIRLEKELEGGAAFDIGIYCINASRYIFKDEPEAVTANLIFNQDKRFTEVDGTVNCMLHFSEGRTAIFSASFAAYEKSSYEVIGTKGSIKVDPAYEYAEGLSLELSNEKGKKIFKQKKHDQFAAEIQYFAECVLKNKKIETDGREGLADIRILNAIFESSEKSQTIKLADFTTDYPGESQEKRFRGADKEDLVHAESASN